MVLQRPRCCQLVNERIAALCPSRRSLRFVDSVRVDTWLWAVRAFPTRTAATESCKGGHVRVNAVPAKAARPVAVGDRVTVRGHGHERAFEVVRLIDKRVGAPIAAECYIDHSPPTPPREQLPPPMFTRDRATGRPTKKDRRQLDRFRRG